jgi:hypothetical protein
MGRHRIEGVFKIECVRQSAVRERGHGRSDALSESQNTGLRRTPKAAREINEWQHIGALAACGEHHAHCIENCALGRRDGRGRQSVEVSMRNVRRERGAQSELVTAIHSLECAWNKCLSQSAAKCC